ncbi:LysM peptidoglycan-binding domain-containing protein [bacterium]|jgi:N-acetylmuramoyl-L-alanine amidase|nr:LysM peptidoglycan-binding domain-containing protein [bacterium]MBT6831474.1 LysM peptidoglycan-binding domain-containing protein [bacterium]MBT6996499.1 LysM peptidoglycan-binding domain-containing protein [bacterium]MBT7772707.1 LysM peptidoglycan-binding domain-containing protein [bacterium]
MEKSHKNFEFENTSKKDLFAKERKELESLDLSILSTELTGRIQSSEKISEKQFVKVRLNWTQTLLDANWKNGKAGLFRLTKKQIEIFAAYIVKQNIFCGKNDKLALIFEGENPCIVIKKSGKPELIFLRDLPVLKDKEKKQKETVEKKLDIPVSYEKYGKQVFSCEEITVEKGDTLYSILRKKRWVDPNESGLLDQIRSINNLDAKMNLKVGMKLKIPIWAYSTVRIDMIYRKANVVIKAKDGDNLKDLYQEIDEIGAIHESEDAFSEIFQKVNTQEVSSIKSGEAYILPGVISLEIKPKQGLHALLSSYGFYGEKSVHQAVFDFNKKRNAEFEKIKNSTSIPVGVNIWVPLGLLSTGVAGNEEEEQDEIEEREEREDREEEREEEREVVSVGIENFQKWFDSIEVKNHSLKKLYVVIDPGHGAKTRNSVRMKISDLENNTGAVHEYNLSKEIVMNEHEINYDISMRLLKKLKENGAHVTTTVVDKNQEKGQIRDGQVLPDGFSKKSIQGKPDEVFSNGKSILPESTTGNRTKNFKRRMKIAKKFFAKQKNVCELLLYLHADARTGKGNDGMGSLYPPGVSKKQHKNDQAFSDIILKEAVKQEIKKANGAGYKDGKLKTRNANIMKYRGSEADARAFLEVGDMLDSRESYLLRTSKYRQKIANVLFEAMKIQYKKLGY